MSVDFDPVKLAPQRRVDPALVGVVVVVIALVVAVIKPWEAGTQAPVPTAAAALAPTASPAGSTSPAPTAPAAPTLQLPPTTPPPALADVASVLETHDGWGVQAISLRRRNSVGLAAWPRYAEIWSPVRSDVNGLDTAAVVREDQSLVAIGVTFPPDTKLQDVRIWQLHANDGFEWIDARPVRPGGVAAGGFLFYRAGTAGVESQPWIGGHYRIDALVDGHIRRIALEITARFGRVPAPDDWPPPDSGLVSALGSNPSGVHSGLFATVDGVGVPLAAVPGALLDEEAAWLDTLEPGGSARPHMVATAYLPRATGLGVMLTDHASVEMALVRRVAPDGRLAPGPMLGGISETQGRTPYVAFGPSGDRPLAPGIYAVTVRWTDPTGEHVATWHVELRPGPDPGPLPPPVNLRVAPH